MHISFSSAPVEAVECDTLIVLAFFGLLYSFPDEVFAVFRHDLLELWRQQSKVPLYRDVEG